MAKGLSSYWEKGLKFGMTNPFTVADIPALLALVGTPWFAKEGDVAVVTGTGESYIHTDVFTPIPVITDWALFNSGNSGDIAFTPAGAIAATDVQAAAEEVDDEKFALDGSLPMAGNLNMGTRALGVCINVSCDQLILTTSLIFATWATVQLIEVYTVNHDAANIPAATVNLEAIAVAGVAVGDHVIGCYCPGMEAQVVMGAAYVSGAAQITIPLGNCTALAIDPAAHDYIFVVLRATT
jgi:hypothetical protein